MNCVTGPPTLQFLKRLAEVFKDGLVHAFDLARWRHKRNRSRNAINNEAQTKLTRQQRCLGPFAFCDIHYRTDAFNMSMWHYLRSNGSEALKGTLPVSIP